MLAVCKDDTLFDIGCGDGRVLVTAAATTGCRCVGIDMNPTRYVYCVGRVLLVMVARTGVVYNECGACGVRVCVLGMGGRQLRVLCDPFTAACGAVHAEWRRPRPL